MIVEILCVSMVKLRRREELSGSERTGITFALGRLGMTPSDRSKISGTVEKNEVNPYK
jgi:hypothetical protein